jgi:isopentenyl-diphosphate Delta-isomerase
VDYILIIIAKVDLDVNPNEVRDTKFVSPEELKEMFKQPGDTPSPCLRRMTDVTGLKFTPWFQLICQKFLFEWWKRLDNLDQFASEKEVIHRMV